MNEQEQHIYNTFLMAINILLKRLQKLEQPFYFVSPEESPNIKCCYLMKDDLVITSSNDSAIIYAFLRGMIYILDK